jgi:murein DD-endopeptidase MepM/ murein hydrolase activator NlpD
MTSPTFVALPAGESIVVAWPTPNHHLFDAPEKFFARTRVNPDYGKPGWTRDCGRRFHRGCDIAPVHLTPTGQTTRVIFTDCATGRDVESLEPIYRPHDDVFAIHAGRVVERVETPVTSDFGRHILLEHRWPGNGEPFFSLYAHLDELDPAARLGATLPTGQRLGRMGQTSRSADARNWMAIAPHLHFEVRNAAGQPYDPVAFLTRYLNR